MDDDRMFSAAELAEAEARGRREALAEIAERALTAAPVNARVADLRQIEVDLAAERERHAEKYADVARTSARMRPLVVTSPPVVVLVMLGPPTWSRSPPTSRTRPPAETGPGAAALSDASAAASGSSNSSSVTPSAKA